jgi:hypothetical protein
MAWTVDFYEEPDGSAPVESFLQGLPKQQRAKALALIKLLEEQGTGLPFPYSSQVRGRFAGAQDPIREDAPADSLLCRLAQDIHAAPRSSKSHREVAPG